MKFIQPAFRGNNLINSNFTMITNIYSLIFSVRTSFLRNSFITASKYQNISKTNEIKSCIVKSISAQDFNLQFANSEVYQSLDVFASLQQV